MVRSLCFLQNWISLSKTEINWVNINRKTDVILVINWDQMSEESLQFYSEDLNFLSEDFFSRAISL